MSPPPWSCCLSFYMPVWMQKSGRTALGVSGYFDEGYVDVIFYESAEHFCAFAFEATCIVLQVVSFVARVL